MWNRRSDVAKYESELEQLESAGANRDGHHRCFEEAGKLACLESRLGERLADEVHPELRSDVFVGVSLNVDGR